MIGLSFTTNPNWIYLFLYTAAIWLVLFFYRKSYKNKKEVKKQIAFGIFSMIVAPTVDVLGTYTNLWHFPDGDVPVIIIFAYFFVGLAAYNVIKLIDR
jgi:hypothetical protein